MTQGLAGKLAGRLAVRQGHWQRMGATPDQIKDRSEHWLQEKLHLLRKGLADPERIELERLDKTRGGLTQDPLAVRPRQSYQVGSPLSSDDILTKSPKEIVEFASSFSDPSRRTDVFTLYRIIADTVAAHPANFADGATDFDLAGSENVAAVLGGFESAVMSGKDFPWAGLLGLIDRVIERRLVTQEGDLRASGWACDSAMSLLNTGLRHFDSGIDEADAARVLRQLLRVIHHTGPVYILNVDGDMDLDTMDASRSKAFDALLGLAWRSRQAALLIEGEVLVAVRRTIESFLDSANAETLNLLGRRLVEIAVALPDQGQRLLASLFPLESPRESFLPAWEGYISNGNVIPVLIPPLAGSYLRAVEELVPGQVQVAQRGPVSGLMAHISLGVVYSQIEELRPALDRFYVLASGPLRRWILEQIALDLFNREKPLEVGLCLRLITFLDDRLSTCVGTHSGGDLEELVGFIRVATTEALSDEWVLPRLLKALRSTSGVEHLSDVIHYLSSTCDEHPEVSVECLTALFLWRVTGDPIGNDKQIKRILASAEDSGILEARQTAEQTRGRLIEEFGIEFSREPR